MNGTNILLVADDSQHYFQSQLFLKRRNRVTLAKGTSQALELVAHLSFEAVVCHLASNSESCYLIHQLRSHPTTASIPLILLAGEYDGNLHRQAMANGADDVLFLPYDETDINNAISARICKNSAIAKKSQEELEQLRRTITTFLPHEMRTALTGITAASELLFRQQNALDPAITSEMLNCINLSGKRLSRLIHNLLLYSELRTISKDLNKVAVLRKDYTADAKTTIADIVDKHTKRYSRHKDITVYLEDAAVQVSPCNFTSLVTELIDNACKFSASGTPIHITSEIEGHQFVFAVCDRGRGMTAEQISGINMGVQFERTVYEQQGLGLGLTIARDIARLYGGKLSIESKPESCTKVSVSLPVAAISKSDRASSMLL